MMAATSFDTTARMVGPRAWRWIHTIGIWLVWTVFMTSEAKRVAGQPVYAVGVALLLGAVALRLVAARMGKERSDV